MRQITLTFYTVEEAQGEQEEEGDTGQEHPGFWFILSPRGVETEDPWSGQNKSPATTEVVT